MSVKRTRNKAVTIRMTAEEFSLFQSKFQKSEMKNQTDFIVGLLKDKPIIVNEKLGEILAELKRQGNNLNQIARVLNQSKYTNKEIVDGVMLAFWDCMELLEDLKKEI